MCFTAETERLRSEHHHTPLYSNSNTRTTSSRLQYLENVLSRFGHHLSAQEQSELSRFMVPSLQSSSQPGISAPSSSVSSSMTLKLESSIRAWMRRKESSDTKEISTDIITSMIDGRHRESPATIGFDTEPSSFKEGGDDMKEEQMDIDQGIE
ncbi:hypothetical protein BX666DRAFT_1879280 [Dichotomocladium elegans]|nr:hypothetical protein BX666DRAFT_1879280 [Dichotomocladium elegans]